MNAATVSGPHSRTISLILLDDDEDLGIAAPEKDLRDATRRDGLQLAHRIRRVRDRLPVDRQNDVALTNARLPGWTIRIDVADECSRATRRQLQPPLELWRQVAQGQPEAAALGFRAVVAAVVVAASRLEPLLLGVEIELLDGDRQRLLLFGAEDLD